jgi:hypothetical protein
VRVFGGSSTTNVVHWGFPTWAQTNRARLLGGDFDGDGFGDVALSGGVNWQTIPVARSIGPNGLFSVTNFVVPSFPALAASSGTKLVTGDFNRDGRTDIAAPGHAGWGTIPIALSNGNGGFTYVNPAVASFPGWASESNVEVLAGDFDGDQRTDLALVGHAGWGTIPVAFSRMSLTGTGTFVVSNLAPSTPSFNVWAAESNVKAVAGDFDADGDADIALTGHAGWETIPVAFSQRTGAFTVTNRVVRRFPSWAAESGVKAVAADFDSDGDADIAITGHARWLTVPFALSLRNGQFRDANMPLQHAPTWSSQAGVQVVATNVDRSDGVDLVLAGGDDWETIPVTFLRR